MAFIMLIFSLYTHLNKSFYYEWVFNFVIFFFFFFASTEMTVAFAFAFVNMVYHVDWSHMLNHPYDPEWIRLDHGPVLPFFFLLLDSVC